MEPGGRPPAPGALALVQAFVNTYDYESRRDDFDSPARLRDWLAGRGLLDGDTTLDQAALRRTREVREALRALLLANNHAPLDPDAIPMLNRLGAGAHLVVRFDQVGQAALTPAAAGLDGALARILAIAATATLEGTWNRLKVCPDDACRWAFYDASKNRSGTWCTMAVCGNRNKVRAYQRRQRQRA